MGTQGHIVCTSVLPKLFTQLWGSTLHVVHFLPVRGELRFLYIAMQLYTIALVDGVSNLFISACSFLDTSKKPCVISQSEQVGISMHPHWDASLILHFFNADKLSLQFSIV